MEIPSSAWPNLSFQSLFTTNNDPEFKSFIARHKVKTNQEVIKLLTCLLVLVYAFTESSYEKIAAVVFSGVLLFIFTQDKMFTVFNYAAVIICMGIPWLRVFFISAKTALFNHATCSIMLLPIMMFTRSYSFSFISFICIVMFNKYNSENMASQITAAPETCADFFKYYTDNCQVIYLIVLAFSFFFTHYNTQALYQFWLKQKECNLLHHQLKTQNQSLEELKKSKTKLLLGLSHEFRNPINAAFGNLELANSRTTDFVVKEHLTNCKVSIEMLFHLVSNLLDSNKLEAGILELNPLQKSSRPMFYKVWEIVKNLLDKQSLLGEFYIHKKIPRMLNVDSHFVVKILLNLILNAIKYTNQGAVMTVITWINENNLPDDMFQPTKGFYSKFLNMTIKKNRVMTTVIKRPVIVRSRSSRRHRTVGDMSSDGSDEIEIPSEGSGGMDEQMHLHAMTRHASIEIVDSFHNLMKDYEKLSNRGIPADTTFNKSIFDNSNPQEVQAKKGFLKIEVYDSGIGMEYNLIKDSLFQKFSSDPRNVDHRLGLGLGLWLTEGLCKFMGGQIRASSEKDKGSQFIAILPMEVSESQQPQHILQALSPTRLASVELRALVVDDDKYNREVNIAFLRKAGVIVAGEAANGDEAVKIFAAKPANYFDLITMDLEMPIMNGKEASKNIREIERLQGKPPVKIIIATGNCDLSEYTACMDGDGNIRADFFFRKPLFQKDVEGFVDIIRQEKALKIGYGS